MSDHAATPHSEHNHSAHDDSHHGPRHYVKVWAMLLVLLIISVTGPMLGHPIVTLVTAFGIAIVKAYMVAKNFMHLNVEKSYIHFLMATTLTLMVLMFAGISPDVMKHSGTNWQNVAAQKVVEAGPIQGEHGHEAAGHEAAGHEAAGHEATGHEAAPTAAGPTEAVPAEAVPAVPAEGAATEAAPAVEGAPAVVPTPAVAPPVEAAPAGAK